MAMKIEKVDLWGIIIALFIALMFTIFVSRLEGKIWEMNKIKDQFEMLKEQIANLNKNVFLSED